MPLPTDKIVGPKTESTSQTYGQLISIPSKKDVSQFRSADSTSVSQTYAISPKDVMVKIVPNDQSNEELGSKVALSDKDRSKISISAFSDTKEPTVSLTRETSRQEKTLEGSALNTFAKVAANTIQHAVVIGSAYKSREDIKKALNEAKKVDMMICLKSADSEDIEFNNLKEINPDVEFTYNFFIPEEEDIVSQEDQSQDPLLKNDAFNVPRYVELNWAPVGVTDELTSEESGRKSAAVQKLKRDTFVKNRGVTGFNSTNFKNSFEKSKKKTNLMERNGLKMEVADIHNLDVALNSTSNKAVFANTVNAVFNVDENKGVVNSLPIMVKKEDE